MPRTMDIQTKITLLRSFYTEEGRVPSYTEMMKLLRYKSRNSVHFLMNKLEKAGYIERLPGRKIAFTALLKGNIRLLGMVEAGFPSPAEEELVDILCLDDFLINNPDATFMLTVSGDSMIDAGIHAGDIVLVEKGKKPRDGDIVIAQVDEEWTIKYFVNSNSKVHLEPANRNYQTIIPKQSLVIGGVVVSVIRKYH
jgi:SOS regulatory protein LexA